MKRFLTLGSIILSLGCLVSAKSVMGADDADKSKIQNVISDAAITTALTAKFVADEKIKSANVKVHTVNGNVEVLGSVPDEKMKSRILEIAKETEGVKNVNLKLQIKSVSQQDNVISDAAITTAIKAKYIADVEIKALGIHVETVNGVVTLTGSVESDEMKDKAVAIARAVDGVKEVRYAFTAPVRNN